VGCAACVEKNTSRGMKEARKNHTEFEICVQHLYHTQGHPIISVNDSIFLKDCLTHDEHPCWEPGPMQGYMRTCNTRHKTRQMGFSSMRASRLAKAPGKGETHVRPVERLTPARRALMRMASKPICTSFPSISGWHTTMGWVR
jgi:hypothetical protein